MSNKSFFLLLKAVGSRTALLGMMVAFIFCGAIQKVHAVDYLNMEEPKLTLPEMKPCLSGAPATHPELLSPSLLNPSSSLASTPKYQFTWMRTNEGVKPYKFMDDLTFVGVPLFVAGIIAKSEKKSFRQNNGEKHVLLTDFKTRIDDYLQFFGPTVTVGLKAAGVEGRSDWGRFLATTAMSYGLMGIFVNGIKYTAKEMRPDGTTANSWPSGHTATAFVGATILHKEYGRTRSPWYSVAAYGSATATGVMRVLNNRHWISDVLSGAGIGIMSGELAYAFSDLIFKGKGLLRNDLSSDRNIIYNPSFFSVSMGAGFGSRNLNFDLSKFEGSMIDDGDKIFNLKFGTSTAVGVEGAYFFNKYIGVGGRLRVNSSPIRGWDGIERLAWEDLIFNLLDDDGLTPSEIALRDKMIYGDNGVDPLITDAHFTIKSDHLTEFSADAGLYFNLPLSSRFALGSKLLFGRSIMQEIDLNATMEGKMYNMTVDGNTYEVTGVNALPGNYTSEWDYVTVGGNNTMKFGTGLSLTYAYKENYAWRLFVDYDYTRKKYTMEYNPGEFMINAVTINGSPVTTNDITFSERQSIKKNRHTFIIGGSFTVSF